MLRPALPTVANPDADIGVAEPQQAQLSLACQFLDDLDAPHATGELGKEEWDGVCAKCHGPEGEGGEGPRIAGSPTLTDIGELTTLLRNGRGAMPAVGADWTDEQIEALVSFLEENPPGGS